MDDGKRIKEALKLMSIQVNKIQVLTCHHCGKPFTTKGRKPLSKSPCPHCQQLVYIPVEFGHYHLYRRIGIDAVSVLFKAFDTTLQRRVFLRIARGSLSKFQTAKLLSSACRFGAIIDTNITKVLSQGQHENQDYIELESVRGEFVQTCIHPAHTLNIKQAMRSAIDLTTSLHKLFKAGLRLGQLSPQNVVLSSPDKHSSQPAHHKTVLFFFGQFNRKSTPESWEQVVPFMAPEAIQDIELSDWFSDVYSLGAMIYFFITGEVYKCPAKGAIASRPLSVKLAAKGFNSELAALLEKMLSRNPIKRDISANTLIKQFESILQAERSKEKDARSFKAERHVLSTEQLASDFISSSTVYMHGEKLDPPLRLIEDKQEESEQEEVVEAIIDTDNADENPHISGIPDYDRYSDRDQIKIDC